MIQTPRDQEPIADNVVCPLCGQRRRSKKEQRLGLLVDWALLVGSSALLLWTLHEFL